MSEEQLSLTLSIRGGCIRLLSMCSGIQALGEGEGEERERNRRGGEGRKGGRVGEREREVGGERKRGEGCKKAGEADREGGKERGRIKPP